MNRVVSKLCIAAAGGALLLPLLATGAQAGGVHAQGGDEVVWTHMGYRCEVKSWKSSVSGRDGRATIRNVKDSTKYARITMTNTAKGQEWFVINHDTDMPFEYYGNFFKDNKPHSRQYRRFIGSDGGSYQDTSKIARGMLTQLELLTAAGAIGACDLNTAKT
ncbi:hypothetical protein RKE29_18585 [Streptomyces sp. B1866]|uniref:hypothetical protein n=1 Tax=Streptomyces sp. B1866 TaxID=3075431 RepID=UPI00288EC41C|nr:hypothetical protein [Streptomyces sp. B1866]MDT3398627.1 hypothetical protein [Streptomyces sp. B1866]